MAYLDFKEAFHTINHDILLNKLWNAGIGQNLLKLLRNYLSNRKQKVKLFGSVSTLEPVTVGIPQGSTIGPVLFIMFINALQIVLESSKALMYANDTVLHCSHQSNKTVSKLFQRNLDAVQKWCEANQLTLNVNKLKS